MCSAAATPTPRERIHVQTGLLCCARWIQCLLCDGLRPQWLNHPRRHVVDGEEEEGGGKSLMGRRRWMDRWWNGGQAGQIVLTGIAARLVDVEGLELR